VIATLPDVEIVGSWESAERVRFVTGVVEATTRGAVPVANEEVICPEVPSEVNVPTLVKEEAVTPEVRVDPVKLPAGAEPEMFTE
jgi:hypothetical protein